MTSSVFGTRGTTEEIERGLAFAPKFDAQGLIPVVTTHAASGEVLMQAWMNAEALEKTISSGSAWYWSRSRKALWHKGDTSGQTQKVIDIRTDCDQDSIWLIVEPAGDGGACHVGYRSCFYRSISLSGDGKAMLAQNQTPLGNEHKHD